MLISINEETKQLRIHSFSHEKPRCKQINDPQINIEIDENMELELRYFLLMAQLNPWEINHAINFVTNTLQRYGL